MKVEVTMTKEVSSIISIISYGCINGDENGMDLCSIQELKKLKTTGKL